ncbi:hypothetical protein VTK73DRAFT_3801 [Phialemonium thermophilum]|uniref:Uncharacterized protein n=1 Tax=Phialemonium thermophilum TaxID=223376 RepID=A0ABR3VEW2_9PEZI
MGRGHLLTHGTVYTSSFWMRLRIPPCPGRLHVPIRPLDRTILPRHHHDIRTAWCHVGQTLLLPHGTSTAIYQTGGVLLRYITLAVLAVKPPPKRKRNKKKKKRKKIEHDRIALLWRNHASFRFRHAATSRRQAHGTRRLISDFPICGSRPGHTARAPWIRYRRAAWNPSCWASTMFPASVQLRAKGLAAHLSDPALNIDPLIGQLARLRWRHVC